MNKVTELGSCTYDKDINGTLYRLAVSSTMPGKKYSGKFVICLKERPEASVNCTVSEKTGNVYPVYPAYPEAVLVGIIFMSIFTAFICGITVRSFIIWYKVDR